jgi:malate dehydrogenase (oxaloacetate-decarboxylating)(NADP+)
MKPMTTDSHSASHLQRSALYYHRVPRAGKIAIQPTKQLTNPYDLSMAYSPGVAAVCDAIVANPLEVNALTARGNLVGVVTNGTAVLGLGNIGPLAAKPVMEGKSVLFKKFAGIDAFDLELDEQDPDRLIDMIAALEPTFGGINLEDIKAPECFYIERKLRERMKIPVFHDDQHGTAIVVGAAVLNALYLTGKSIDQIKLVVSGAGAAALACLDLLMMLGLPVRNIWVTDLDGVVYAGRVAAMDPVKAVYAQETAARTLDEVITGADVFLGLSAGGVLRPEMVARMADQPIILALANPTPEIMPEEALAVRSDAIVATGRSDYPNQVNNVLCFPFIFRGALDVGATTINAEMKLAAVHALVELARVEMSDVVQNIYGATTRGFGPDYLIPKPFDPRLIVRVAPAVARAAMDSGVATRPIASFASYIQQLNEFVYQSGMIMKPIFAYAKHHPQRLMFAEGEDVRVLRAVQQLVDEGMGRPILIGKPEVMRDRIERSGLRMEVGVDFDCLDMENNPSHEIYWREYYRIMKRKGVSIEYAMHETAWRRTLVGAMAVHLGDADGLLCGTFGTHDMHRFHLENIIGFRDGVDRYAAMNLLMLPGRTLFIADTYVNYDPTAAQVVQMTLLACQTIRNFGITPRVALLSHSSFGSDDTPSARKMREALLMLREQDPELEVDGEMHGDAALDEAIRDRVFPDSTLRGPANLLVMPNLDAANITFNLLKVAASENLTVGPILLGAAQPVHILTPTATVRRIVNMAALAISEVR